MLVGQPCSDEVRTIYIIHLWTRNCNLFGVGPRLGNRESNWNVVENFRFGQDRSIDFTLQI